MGVETGMGAWLMPSNGRPRATQTPRLSKEVYCYACCGRLVSNYNCSCIQHRSLGTISQGD